MDCLWAGIERSFGAQSSASLCTVHRNSGTFSVADILMADVLRLVDRFDGLANYPACRDYVARATARRPSRRHTQISWRILPRRMQLDIPLLP